MTGYLLATGHPVSGPKARYLAAKAIRSSPEGLEAALLRIACEGEVVETEANRWGTKDVVEGEVTAPVGDRIRLRTVWMEANGAAPVLVTAYPA